MTPTPNIDVGDAAEQAITLTYGVLIRICELKNLIENGIVLFPGFRLGQEANLRATIRLYETGYLPRPGVTWVKDGEVIPKPAGATLDWVWREDSTMKTSRWIGYH